MRVCTVRVCDLAKAGLIYKYWANTHHKERQTTGGSSHGRWSQVGAGDRSPCKIWSGGDNNMDVVQSFCLLGAYVHMVLWYDATTFFTQVNQGQSQVLDILRHSGSDPQTLRWIDVTGSSSTLIRPQPFHLSPETTGGVFIFYHGGWGS